MRKMFRLPRMLLILVVTGAVLVPSAAIAAPPASGCTIINEHIHGITLSAEFDDAGNITSNVVTGDAFGGTALGMNTVTKITPGGVLHFTGVNEYTGTDYGDFQTTTKGNMTPGGKLRITIHISEGGSGHFTTHGTFDITTGDWELQYRGRICV